MRTRRSHGTSSPATTDRWLRNWDLRRCSLSPERAKPGTIRLRFANIASPPSAHEARAEKKSDHTGKSQPGRAIVLKPLDITALLQATASPPPTTESMILSKQRPG